MGFGSWPTLSAKLWTISGHVLKYPCGVGLRQALQDEGRLGEPFLDHGWVSSASLPHLPFAGRAP